MANYKVVNSDQLDSDLTVVADAIREKSGTSGKMAFPNGMADAVRNISSGVELPELSNPGSASDLAQGKQFIDENGNVIEGTIPVVEDEARYFAYDIWDSDKTEMDNPYVSEYPNCVQILGNIFDDMLISDIVGMFVYVPKSVFGDAQPSDVRKGVTFTASGGVRAEGTMEAESGGVQMRVEGETLYITGDVTVENGTLIL